MKMKYLQALILSAAMIAALPLQADPVKLALVVFKKGDASLVRNGKVQPAKVKDLIQEKDEIRTGAGGELSLQLSSGVLVKVAANSSLVIEGIARDEKGSTLALRLNNGTLLGKASKESGKDLNLTVHAPTAIAGVRGTEFIVDANAEQSSVLVDEGVVNVSDATGSRSVDCEAGNKVVSDGKELVQGVLDAYEKQRFAIFERFEKEKQKSFETVVEQIRKNKELMEQQKQNMP
ncbi:FecR family protein [Leptonema illini]|jgi:hypothetical protein|uniref:FecR protein n=1 Tax=Leptonema illini DSM 21528 TaxID=929563 RepID=H2CH47_9LEPT|nr:FecR family protein [Leptonema illini]EHQ06917.1 FecR protein [Leptonema illini DSM 21528]